MKAKEVVKMRYHFLIPFHYKWSMQAERAHYIPCTIQIGSIYISRKETKGRINTLAPVFASQESQGVWAIVLHPILRMKM